METRKYNVLYTIYPILLFINKYVNKQINKTNIYIYIYTYIHTYIYTYIYIYTQLHVTYTRFGPLMFSNSLETFEVWKVWRGRAAQDDGKFGVGSVGFREVV